MSLKARAREVMNDLKTITAPMRFTCVLKSISAVRAILMS